jgi:hypothetical protein
MCELQGADFRMRSNVKDEMKGKAEPYLSGRCQANKEMSRACWMQVLFFYLEKSTFFVLTTNIHSLTFCIFIHYTPDTYDA